MISRLPGWLNFLVLQTFYLLLMLLQLGIVYLLYKWLGWVGIALAIAAKDYAGGYLAKWREKQGGGWVFD